jgi:hypothetical protein
MPGFLFHEGASAACQHSSGQVVIITKNKRVFVNNGLAVVTSADDLKVAPGCPFTVPGPKPQPCDSVKLVPAVRVRVNGSPVILVSQGPTPGVCLSKEQIPQGVPIVNFVQTRVTGT